METDILIIGGGAVGRAAAFFLKDGLQHPDKVTLIDRDLSGARSQTVRSAAAIRQIFASVENIRMSQESLRQFENLKTRFGPEGDIGYHRGSYLVLADGTRAATLRRDVSLQNAHDAPTQLLDPAELAARFSWLETDGLACGAYGASGEGWFDAWRLMSIVGRAAKVAGADFLAGTATRLLVENGAVKGAALADGREIRARMTILTAGCHTRALLETIGLSLPVHAKKRTVFSITCPDGLPDLPLVADPSGFWVRPEGAGFIAGWTPPPDQDPDSDPDDDVPDTLLFDDVLWPLLAARIRPFERLRMQQAWAGHYDMNILDHNALIGPLADIEGLLVAAGFSGHGVQHALPMGRALAELSTSGRYLTLDLSALGAMRDTASHEAQVI